tara:strand:+ start:1009 stop:3873 length:2865 start_codon:yes stop_codon:yes gene_type:complete
MATPEEQIMAGLGLDSQVQQEEEDLRNIGVPVSQGFQPLEQSDAAAAEAFQSRRAQQQQDDAPLEVSDPDALAAFQMSKIQNKEDEFTTKLSDDLDGFTLGEVSDTAGILGSYINKGLVGNLLDLPGGLLNIATGADPSDFRYVRPFSQNFLGLDTGRIFDPSRQPGSDELKESLRPLGVGLEFAAGAVGPQALINRSAQIAAPAIRSTPFVKGGQQALAPTNLVRQPLPTGFQSVGGSIAQQQTGRAGNLMAGGVGALSGVGAFGASNLSDGSPLAEAAGAIGLPIAALIGARSGAGLYSLFKTSKDLVGKKAVTESAIDQMATHSTDFKKSVLTTKKNLAEGKTGDLGVLSEDPGLMSFVKLMRSKGSPSKTQARFSTQAIELDEKSSRQLLTDLQNVTDETADTFFSDFVKGREQGLAKAIQGQADNARLEAKSAMERAGTTLELSPDEAAQIATKQADQAAEAATTGLNKLWDAVPDSFVNRANVEKAAKSFLNRAALDTDQEVIAAGKTLDPYFKALLNTAQKGRVPAREIIKFRSNMLQVTRNLKAKNESNSALQKLADDAQEQILGVLENSKASVAYRRAADETKKVHDIFKRGDIDFTDTQTIGKRMLGLGEGGAERVDQIAKAAGYNEGLIGAADDYVRAAFANSAIKNGVVVPKSAETFLKKHQSYLAQPQNRQLRAELEDAAFTQKATDTLIAKQSQFTSERAKAAFNTFSELADPVRAVQSVLRNKQPRKAMSLLVRQAAKDPTGDALEGLRRTFVKTLIQKASGQKVGVSEILEGKVEKLKGTTAYDDMKPVLNDLFGDSPEQLKVIDDVFSQIKNIQRASSAPAAADSVVERVAFDSMLQYIGIRAAPIVSKGSGAGALSIAGKASSIMKKLFSERPKQQAYQIIEELMVNPEKYAKAAAAVANARDEVEMVRAATGFLDSFTNPALYSEEEEPVLRFTP